MRRIGLILFPLILLLGGEVFAQNNIGAWIIQNGLSTDYPCLYIVTLGGVVSDNVSDGYFYYIYTLTSGGTNRGDIWTFEIDISRQPRSVAYDTLGLRFTNKFEQNLFRRYYPGAENISVPVGFPTLPNRYWTADIEHDTVASFNVDTLLPGPGSSVSGLVMMSKGLPGIRAFTAYSYFDVGKYTPDIDADTTAALDSIYTAVGNYIDSMATNVNYSGWTIGPTAPPSNFDGSSWLDTLTSYATRSLSLGWIKDQATADKYLGYFASAKMSLQQNNVAAARLTLQQVLQDVNTDSTSNITSEAYALLRYNTEYLLAQLPVPPSGFIVKLINSSGANLTAGSLQYYEGSWKDATNNNDGTFTINTTAKTLSLRMTYEYGTQTKSNVTVGPDTAVFQTVSTQIKLEDSKGNPIDTGTVQYYAGAWRSFGVTMNGTATMELLPNSYSFRMTYAYASNDKQQDVGANPTVVFQSVNTAVQFQNSHGSLIDTGTVQYYAGAWRGFGTTSNGIATMELLPNSYSFRMTYAYASNDKQQDIGADPTVVFQTVNTVVQLQNSQGSLMDQGTVQYYSGAWRSLGTTSNGVATMELLPNNYSFRMTYAYGSNDKQQNIGTNPTVVFQTVNAIVQLKNSQGNQIDTGTVQYYAGAWRNFAATTNGVTTKELLPANYTFRMTYQFVSNDKAQDISANSTVTFSTVLCTVRVTNSQNQLVNNVQASYYSGAWLQIGSTVNGEVTKELLPASLTFRITYGTSHQDETQNLSTSNVVEFNIP